MYIWLLIDKEKQHSDGIIRFKNQTHCNNYHGYTDVLSTEKIAFTQTLCAGMRQLQFDPVSFLNPKSYADFWFQTRHNINNSRFNVSRQLLQWRMYLANISVYYTITIYAVPRIISVFDVCLISRGAKSVSKSSGRVRILTARLYTWCAVTASKRIIRD